MKRISSLMLALVLFSQTALTATPLTPDFRYDQFVIKNIAFDYNVLKTKEQFLAKFGAGLRPEDRKEMQENFKLLKALPKLVSGGTWMKLSADGISLTVDLTRAPNKIIVVNGVQAAFDTSAPLGPQVKILMKKVARQGNDVSRVDLFLPKAYAIAPIIMGALGFVAMALAGKVIERYGNTGLDILDYNACWVMKEKMKILSENGPVCKEYIKQQKEIAAKNPEVQAVAEALKEPTSKEPIEVSSEVCSHHSPDQTYRSTVQLLEDNIRARVEISFENGKVKEFKVLDEKSDKVIATYILNEQQILEKIRLPNPAAAKAESDKMVPANLEISATDNIEDPLLSAEQRIHKSLFTKIGERLGTCKARSSNMEAKNLKKKAEGTK